MSMRATSARYSGDSLFRISSTLCPSSGAFALGGPDMKGVPPPSLRAGMASRLLLDERMRASAVGTAATTCCALASCRAGTKIYERSGKMEMCIMSPLN